MINQKALIGMGSNIEPEANLKRAAATIKGYFPEARFSKVYRSAAVGMAGDDFLNACCLIETGISERDLRRWLKGVEDEHDRDRRQGSWQPRTLDLDLLLLGDTVLDEDVYKYAHASVPAAELVDMELPTTDSNILTLQSLRL